ncbi:MAG: MFS transporter [Actinomycetota bacterium]|nr:MFS transporter [Actinomycetota bacterium]
MKSILAKIDDPKIRSSLIYSIIDGCLWAVMFGFCENYIVPFILSFGANSFMASLIQGIFFLGILFGQIIGPLLIKLKGQRKAVAVTTIRIQSICILLIILVAYLTKSPALLILLYFISTTSSNAGGPAWISLMNDLVPRKLRGAYWSIRNRFIGFTQFISIIIAGICLFVFKKIGMEIVGYSILFVAGAIARFLCGFFMSKQYEPPLETTNSQDEFRFIIFLRKIFTTNFGRFALFQFLMAFSVNIMSPILNIHVIESLHFNYIQFMAYTLSFMAASFISVTYWGALSDRYGNYKIIATTSISLPILAFIWIFNRNFYTILLTQIFSGFVWSGFNLSTQNFLFDAVRRENVAKISSYYSILTNLFAFAGTTLGGILTLFTKRLHITFFTSNNYELIFILSFLLRTFVALFLIRSFKEVRNVEAAPSLAHFYIYMPVNNIVNKFNIITGRKITGRKK